MEHERLKGASQYAITDSGHIYNIQTQRRVKRTWVPARGCFVSRVMSDEGLSQRVYHDDLVLRPVSSSGALDPLRAIQGYPDYQITSYGAVWRIKQGSRRRPRLMTENYRGNTRYVQLLSAEGKRHNRRVSDLIEMAWNAPTPLETPAVADETPANA